MSHRPRMWSHVNPYILIMLTLAYVAISEVAQQDISFYSGFLLLEITNISYKDAISSR